MGTSQQDERLAFTVTWEVRTGEEAAAADIIARFRPEARKEKGLEPRRHFSGKFNLRISPELHERLAIEAQAQGKSINTLVQEALQERVAS